MSEWTAQQMREELWACYCASGADPDGADARHLNPGETLYAVRELMRDYDEAIGIKRPDVDLREDIPGRDAPVP